MNSSALSACAQEVYRHDRDRFLATLCAPACRREGLFALHAFNLEISRIPDTVSEEMIGHIRFAWWREALDELYAGKQGRAHRVVRGLEPMIAEGRLSRAHFDRLMAARQEQFAAPGFETTADFLAYCEASSSSLLALCLESTGRDGAAGAVRLIGIAYAALGHARAVAFHAARGRVTVPRELLARYGIDPEQLLAGQRVALAPVLRELVEGLELPASRDPLLRPYLQIACHWRARLRKAGYDPFDARIGQGRGMLALKMLAVSYLTPGMAR